MPDPGLHAEPSIRARSGPTRIRHREAYETLWRGPSVGWEVGHALPLLLPWPVVGVP
jgi:hypothetical protein